MNNSLPITAKMKARLEYIEQLAMNNSQRVVAAQVAHPDLDMWPRDTLVWRTEMNAEAGAYQHALQIIRGAHDAEIEA